MNDIGDIQYASFGKRLLAALIDTLLIIFVVSWLINFIAPPPEFIEKLSEDFRQHQITEDQYLAQLQDFFVNQGGMSVLFTNSILQLLIIGAVVIGFWLYSSSTPGKMIFSMRIVDEKTFSKPSISQLIIRYLGYFVSSIPLFAGFFWIAFDEKRQGWHDKMSGTVVIIAKKKPENNNE